MASTFEQALPGLLAQQTAQTGTSNIMDALAAYNQAQQQSFFAPPPAPAVSTPATTTTAAPPPVGIAALPVAPPAYEASAFPDVASLYQKVLGRDPTKTGDAGLEWWQKEIGAGGISPEDYQKFVAAAKPELDVQSLYRQYLGRGADPEGLDYWKNKIASEGISPEEREMFYKTAAPEIVTSAYRNILGRAIPTTDTGLDYYVSQLQSGAITPQSLASSIIGGARGEDIVPAQAYNILGSPNYLARFEKAQANIEKDLGLPAGSLSTGITQQDLATKSLEEIQNILRTSGANKYQEATRAANDLQDIYGLDEAKTKQLGTNLLKNQSDNQLAKEYYDALVQGKSTKDIRSKIIADAAKKNPDSQYFKENPDALKIYKPIGEVKAIDKGSGQYDRLSNGLPILNREVGDKKVLGEGEVIRGLDLEFRDRNQGLEELGADIESDYQGRFAKGVGTFGVTANQRDVTDFAKIRKEIDKLGGITREADGSDYVDIQTSDGVQRIRAQDFFNSGGEFGYNGDQRYAKYLQTQDILQKIAARDKVDPSSFKDIKEMYDFFNDKYKDDYVWQGRAQSLGLTPEQAKDLGINFDPNDSRTHVNMRLKAVDDKLIPTSVSGFEFQDPKANTIGREVTREILLNPVFLAAATSGFGASELGMGLADSVGQSVITNLGLDATLANSGLSFSQIGQLENLIGRSILSGAQSGIVSALATGDAEKFLQGFASGAAGTGITGLTQESLGPMGSQIAGSTAARALAGQEIDDYLTRQLTGAGLSSLLSMVDPGAGQAARIFTSLSGPMSTGKLTPNDIVALSRAIGREQR